VVVPFIVGVLSSWLVAFLYYKKSREDASNQQWSSRLDWLEKEYKAFIVAVFNLGEPMPLYTKLLWTGIAIGGKSFGTLIIDGPDIFKHINSRTPYILMKVRHLDKPIEETMFWLTDYGKDCAKYLIEHEIESAQLEKIGSSHSELLEQYGGNLHGPQCMLGAGISTDIMAKKE
jgi:hypothetical protein